MSGSVLIAEDDKLSLEMLERRLGSVGLETESVTDGEACLARLEQEPLPDLVLLDLNMPVMDGIEVTKRVRKKWSRGRLPIIMVTGRVDSDDVVEGLEAGANDYVTKPITFPVLLARVKVCLAIKQGVDALMDAERQRMMLESLGAACHHLSEPLSSLMAGLDVLQDSQAADPDKAAEQVRQVREWAESVGGILEKMRRVSTYRTDSFMSGAGIADMAYRETQAKSDE